MMRRALPLPSLATLLLLASACATTGTAPAEADILQLVSEQTEAWNRQDAVAWSKDFAQDASFINIVGTVFEGRDEIQQRHAGIFASIFKGSQSQVTVRKVQFIREDLAIVDATHAVTGHPGLPPGVQDTEPGLLRTQMRYVMKHANGQWQILAGQNTDVKPRPQAAAPQQP
ncbi:SgcJ/EcaC family oxidoreductase [Myxococcus sp. SDU36]|uniref:SgcJ/EcaC family oxidoreductase n=1 Tax=Myxococcus sp. SDU36 TaxID=2831967 RepID=UPI002542D5B6|nr:SgcJ/EcaC family oxidoreductase [Myxococcus sp. SDU36]WIG97779.1 SgcJ/EcaC family oxidoreductase [Myxococcus sp. SDU36]